MEATRKKLHNMLKIHEQTHVDERHQKKPHNMLKVHEQIDVDWLHEEAEIYAKNTLTDTRW